MPTGPISAAAEAAISVGQQGMAMLNDSIASKRQFKYNKKMLEESTKANKDIGRYNQELAYEMWDRTNADAQVKQLQKAGLSTGLMYKGSGAGGTTSGGAAGSVGGQGVSMANSAGSMGMLQQSLMQAQIENLKADADKKKVEANKIGGVDTEETKGRIGNIAADVANKGVQKQIMEFDAKLKEIDTRISTNTETARSESPELVNRQLVQSIEKIVAETRTAQAEGTIKSEAADSLIMQLKANAIEQQLRIGLAQGGIIKQGVETAQIRRNTEKIASEIAKMYTDMRIGNESVNQRDLEIQIKQKLAELTEKDVEFRTGWGAETERASRIIENSAGAIGKILPIGKAIRGKDFPTKKPEWMSDKHWEQINND